MSEDVERWRWRIWERGQTDLRAMDRRIWDARLSQTIAWCSNREDIPKLRSTQLSPILLHEGRDDIVCDVGSQRELALLHRTEVDHASANLNGGRLLVYLPDQQLADGMAEFETGGFLDVFSAPPFDTWIAWFDESDRVRREGSPLSGGMGGGGFLVSYVPPELVEPVGRGIDVDCVGCIFWFSELEGDDVTRLS